MLTFVAGHCVQNTSLQEDKYPQSSACVPAAEATFRPGGQRKHPVHLHARGSRWVVCSFTET